MVQTQSGFIPGQETHTLHTRRRYHLISGPKNNPNAAPFNPNLWLFHYIRAEHLNQLPVSSIPLGSTNITQAQALRQQIQQLQQHGTITQQQFSLYDKSTWPSLALTPQMPAKQQGNPRGTGTPNRGHLGASQAPNKRQKLPIHQGTPQPGPSNMPHAPSAAGRHDPPLTIDEEEDTSRGDMLDHLSPREISQTRYIQHHEWMEEVLGSAYPISKIKPVDLGLGLRGELEALTKGFLEPATFPLNSGPRKIPAPRVPVDTSGTDPAGDSAREGADDSGHMDPAVLEVLTGRAEAKLREIEEEMEHMKQAHQQRLAKVQNTGTIKEAEMKVRANINFNMFGILDSSIVEESAPISSAANSSIEEPRLSPPVFTISDDEIVVMVEESLGKKIVQREMVIRWDLETGKEIIGNDDLLQDDKDEIMGNIDDDGSSPPLDSANNESPQQNETNGQNPSSDSDEIPPLGSSIEDDVNIDNDETMMDEPSNFADAFDARELEEPEDGSSATATPHLVLPSQQGSTSPMGGTPSMNMPSPCSQPGALSLNTLAGGIPSPSTATTSTSTIDDGKNTLGSMIPVVPMVDANATVPSGGVSYTGIPGLGGDHQGLP